jgi:Leucine-rich repeat (LRR) protein
MNPAFAAAHGLTEDLKSKKDQNSSNNRIKLALKEARATGKLYLVNIQNLPTPLPNVLFDFHSSFKVDLSIDNYQPLNQYTEDSVSLVDLSDNSSLEGSFDERFVKFKRCQIFRFKQCNITSMPLSLESLECLTILDFSGNKFQSFKMSLVPPALKELYLTNNCLENLHASSESMELQLKVLDISHNQLSECNISCPHLRNLQCHHNRFTMVPSILLSSAQESLETLDLSHNQLRASLDFSTCNNLKTLKLSANRIGPSSPIIPLCLKYFDVANNMIKDIQSLLPTTAAEASLFELFLHGNHLSGLDAQVIEKCINLNRLDLSSNKLKNLPYQLGLLPKIQTLRLASNPLFTFKRSDVESNPNAVLEVLRQRAPKQDQPSISNQSLISCIVGKSIKLVSSQGKGNRGRPAAASSAKPVDLNQFVQELKAYPQTAMSLTQKLMLNGFDIIPDELFTLLPNITLIDISRNNLESLSASLASSCPKLERLYLSFNVLSDLSIFHTGPLWSNSLKHLDLSCNRFEVIPIELLSRLVVLDTLNLSCNKLGSIDNCSWFPSTLIHLDLSENSIKDMETLVWTLARRCPNIRTLRLSQNKLAKIPPLMGLFLEKRLTSLDLRFNPQQAIRHAILEKPCKDQLAYLKNRISSEEVAAAMEQLGGGQLEEENTPERFKLPKSSRTSVQPEPMKDTSAVCESSEVEPSQRTTLPQPRAQDLTSVEESPSNDPERDVSLALIEQHETKMQALQNELDKNYSLSQAKRYAVKKSLQMERSKMIREERKLGLRK